MTDNTPAAPRFTLCEGFAPDITGCGLLMPVDAKLRAGHRRWHIHENKVTQALRDSNKDLAGQVRQLTGRVQELENDVHNIDIPEPVEPLTIVAADDLDPLEDDDDFDDQPQSQYVDDEPIEDDEEPSSPDGYFTSPATPRTLA